MVPALSHRVSRVPWYSGFRAPFQCFAYGAFTLSGRSFQFLSAASLGKLVRSIPRRASRSGLGSFPFARRYSGNRFFFLFLRLLRCFSSPGSLPYTIYSCTDTWSLSMWVPPFRYPRLMGYLLLPAAFRSLSRLSSAPSAKASAPRPFCLTIPAPYSVTEHFYGLCCFFFAVLFIYPAFYG